MQSVTTEAEVPLAVGHCIRALNSSTDTSELISTLQTLNGWLADGPGGATSAEFRSFHYTRTLRVLIDRINADWVQKLTATQRRDLWDGLFLRGPPEQTLLVLTDGLRTLRWVVVVGGCFNIHLRLCVLHDFYIVHLKTLKYTLLNKNVKRETNVQKIFKTN